MLYFAPWKMVLVALVCVIGVLFSLPNFLDRETAEKLSETIPARQLNLGLDLQGGSHALLEVGIAEVVQEELENREDAIRQALREARVEGKRVRYRNLGVSGESVTVQLTQPEQFETALEAIRGTASQLRFNLLTGTGGGDDIEVEATSDGLVTVRLTEESKKETLDRVVEQAIEVLRRRVDELGVSEPTIQRQGAARILLQLPGVSSLPPMQQAKMVFRMVDQTANPNQVRQGGSLPSGSELLESYERNPDGSPSEYFVVRKKVEVSGEHLVDAQTTYDRGQPVVSFRFDTVGGEKFGKVTAANVGRPFAIVLDDRVISAPVIRQPILGGSGIITGNFSVPEANELSLLLRAGALPAAIIVIEQRTVGPSLGQDSIDAGEIAAIIAFALVMVFMVLSYGIFGLAADIALVINLFLIMGLLSMLQATLTLPGIAGGIVLTIGMAVDANVLVFERIREEIRAGKTPFAAMDAGYQRALGTILDANVTTFLAATILFAMGSGPVRGFAVTLGIGILTSVFTAVTVTRLMLVIWLRRTRPATLPV